MTYILYKNYINIFFLLQQDLFFHSVVIRVSENAHKNDVLGPIGFTDNINIYCNLIIIIIKKKHTL